MFLEKTVRWLDKLEQKASVKVIEVLWQIWFYIKAHDSKVVIAENNDSLAILYDAWVTKLRHKRNPRRSVIDR